MMIRSHFAVQYENMQFFLAAEKDNFQVKIVMFFLFLLKTLIVGTS